jgi:hypothetical protein
MKIQELFDLLGAAQDHLSYFDGVQTPTQVISRLEHLKHQDPEYFMEDLNALRIATQAALSANLELGGSLSTDDDLPDDLQTTLDEFPDVESPLDTSSHPSPDDTQAPPSRDNKENNTP